MKTLAKLPVTIVTGFLGSGKTTLLRHMLDNAQGRRIAVIVNEFGELGIDGDILKQCSIGCTEEEANGRVYELANGCLCCTVQEEFFPVMRELVARRGDLDHILIETSGLALPKPLVQAFQWPEIRTACTVDAVITVVDSPAVAAGTFAAYPDQVDAQRKLDPNLDHESPLHELFADQLASADLVVLNKADLIDADGLAKVRAEVAEELPAAVKVIEASSGKLPLEVLLGLGAESEQHIDARPTHHDAHHDGDDHD
ncbi:MAG TPA: cobalamin biosynthesis protein CobW, partial [Pseudomonas sp.]|nr:cobalamin biosynthesis protein CobW [Pseudomonas sp.]